VQLTLHIYRRAVEAAAGSMLRTSPPGRNLRRALPRSLVFDSVLFEGCSIDVSFGLKVLFCACYGDTRRALARPLLHSRQCADNDMHRHIYTSPTFEKPTADFGQKIGEPREGGFSRSLAGPGGSPSVVLQAGGILGGLVAGSNRSWLVG